SKAVKVTIPIDKSITMLKPSAERLNLKKVFKKLKCVPQKAFCGKKTRKIWIRLNAKTTQNDSLRKITRNGRFKMISAKNGNKTKVCIIL
ncbi:MAG: hypothetical protein PHG68_03145, partial [Candidatus Omnitrophica bacterium]|nr:hypothetical protein [Candidatus Omnitrophota bacterium]